MSLFLRTLLATQITAALFVPTTQAETPEPNSVQEIPSSDQCLIPDSSKKSQDEPITVEANALEGINGDKATYKGDVVVVQGNKRITADKVTLHQTEDTVVAEGNVNFSDGQVKTISDKATTNLKTDQATLESAKYEFLCESGRGDAEVIYRSGKKFYELEDGSLTSCPEGDNAWRLRASSIEIDQDAEEATFYNPRVEIVDIPVFYLPYLTVPIGDTRKTGFLYPSMALDSRDGFSLSVPVYWNLAPNYDLRTTINYMEKRGTQLDATFRYLTELGDGSFDLEYLPEDSANPDKGRRWGYNWSHSGVFLEKWKFDVDYSKVSDNTYFSDLSSSIGNREDGQLLQSGEVSYRSTNWDTTLRVRDFQVLSSGSTPYRLMPELEYNYYAPHFYSKLDFNLKSHISRFETDDSSKPSATRLHFEPTLALPLTTTWGSITTEAKLYQTYYQQDLDGIDITDTTKDLEEEVSRTIPLVRVHSGIVLERENPIIDGYNQTLEPQAQFLYVKDVDQSDIYAYDTTKLQLDYNGLFRSQNYSSVDYIAPANQVSYGASSRFFDESYRERMNISFGQIIYLNSSYNDSVSGDKSSSYSAWAMETEFNYDDTFYYQGGFQYDTATSDVQLADSTLEYRYQNGFSQLNYRYVSIDYIANNVEFTEDDDDLDTYTKKGISQMGFITGYTFNRKWRLNGQYFYDLNENVNLEWLAGLTYTTDCWYIGMSYSNQLYSWEEIGVGDPNYEQNLSVNFGIIGFGTTLSAGSGIAGVDSSNAALGYGRPFYLNN